MAGKPAVDSLYPMADNRFYKELQHSCQTQPSLVMHIQCSWLD
jgi:hypothetical protein